MRRLVQMLGLGSLAMAALTPSAVPQQPQVRVDIELVLAVDTSRSMDEAELTLQRGGYVEAFREKDVAKAITSGPEGRIAVLYMEWGADYQQNVLIPWTIIDSRESALAFANRLADESVYGLSRTSISNALLKAAELTDTNSITSHRRVIDVSGDGPNNAGPGVEQARDDVVRRGFTINGLPIMLRKMKQFYDIDHLDRYYKQCVIGGPASFIAPVFDLKQLAATVRKKLVLEIAGADIAPPGTAPTEFADAVPGAGVVRAQLKLPTEKQDCFAGEKRVRGAYGGFSGGGEGVFP